MFGYKYKCKMPFFLKSNPSHFEWSWKWIHFLLLWSESGWKGYWHLVSRHSGRWIGKSTCFLFLFVFMFNTVSSDLLELFIFSLGLTEYEFEQKDQEFSRFSIFCSWFSRSLIVICVICKSFLIYVISNPSSKIFRPASL